MEQLEQRDVFPEADAARIVGQLVCSLASTGNEGVQHFFRKLLGEPLLLLGCSARLLLLWRLTT